MQTFFVFINWHKSRAWHCSILKTCASADVRVNENALQIPITYVLVTNEDEYGLFITVCGLV